MADLSTIADPGQLMPGAAPIVSDSPTTDTGILFFHGYTGSPYEGRDLAEYFTARNVAVWSPLLAGHGTRPKDLENISHTVWLESARKYFRDMKARYRRVIVCGQSMGGALALHVAAHEPVDALITLAGAVFVKDWRLPMLPVARRILRYFYKSKGPDIRSPEAKIRAASYPCYPLDSLVEFLDLIAHVKGELPTITCPALIIHSRRDHTITFENLDFIYRHIGSPDKTTLVLEESYHVISVDLEKDRIFRAMEAFMGRIPQ